MPDPVLKVQVIAKPNSALISWENSTRAINYRVYLVIQEMLIPINDGEGLDVKTNQVTMNSVFLFFFSTFEFFSLQIKKNKQYFQKKKKLTEGTDYIIRIYSGNSGGFETIGKTIQFQTPISGIIFSIF